jgi:hypothetical protein
MYLTTHKLPKNKYNNRLLIQILLKNPIKKYQNLHILVIILIHKEITNNKIKQPSKNTKPTPPLTPTCPSIPNTNYKVLQEKVLSV